MGFQRGNPLVVQEKGFLREKENRNSFSLEFAFFWFVFFSNQKKMNTVVTFKVDVGYFSKLTS